MANGGARPNAGRPLGIPNKQSVKLQTLVEQRDDVSPGRVMLETMWRHYSRASVAQAKVAAAPDEEAKEILETKVDSHLDRAHAAARDVAPYVHTRLSSVIVQGNEDGGAISHRHTGVVGVAALSAADLAKLDAGQLAALYRETISETERLAEEPAAHPGRIGDVPA